MAGANTLRGEIVARDFNRMLDELAAIDPAIEFRDVILGAAERVVNSAARHTRVAKAERVRANFELKEWTTFNGKKYRLSNRFPDETWQAIEAFRRERLNVRLNAIGLSKRSWKPVAESFGATLNAPGYVAAANYKGRQYEHNGESREIKGGPNFALEIINYSPIVQAAGGYGALIRAMAGETRYFEMNMEKRAFATLESRVKKYPQIFARRGA